MYVDSFLILILFVAYCTGNIKNILILYVAVIIHELAHLSACLVLNEKINGIRFMPYGVNLEIKSVKNPLNMMMISAAGPLMSLLMIIVLNGGSKNNMNIFEMSNLAVFWLNVFPALPLDGGTFLESLLSYRCGYIRAHRKMIEMTRITCVVFAVFGFIFILISKYNISLLVISAFLMYNLKEERKKFVFLRQIIYTKEFDHNGKGLKIRHCAVCRNVVASALTDSFGYNYICHFFVYDEDMNLLGTLTQGEIVDGVILNGADVTVGRLLNGGTNEHKGKSTKDIADGVKTDQIYR